MCDIELMYFPIITLPKNITVDIKQELDTIIKIIADTVPVESIYLFGSYAYGTPNKDSDLDLYIVFKDAMLMQELKAIDIIYKALSLVETRRIEIFGSKQNLFDKRKFYALIEKKIIKEGIKLFG